MLIDNCIIRAIIKSNLINLYVEIYYENQINLPIISNRKFTNKFITIF